MIEHPRLSDGARTLISGIGELLDEGWLHATGPRTIDLIEPGTGMDLGVLPRSTSDDVTSAVAGAREAFDISGWGKSKPLERHEILSRL